MKKLFAYSLFLILPSCFCFAQDTLVYRNGKKIVGKVISVGKERVTYILPPDSTPLYISSWRMDYIAYPGGTKFNFTEKKKMYKPSSTDIFLSLDAGASVPAASYRDGIVGTHFGARATFYVSRHIGFVLKASSDFNGTGLDYISSNYWGGLYIFQQYLGGFSYRIGGHPGFPWVDFVAAFGIATVTTPISEQGGGDSPLVVYTPGSGKGPGTYFGVDFTSSADHFCSLTFGAGCEAAIFTYPSYQTTVNNYDPYSGITTKVSSNSASKMDLMLFQMYVGLNFHLKKSQR